jgi:hypothetical protein
MAETQVLTPEMFQPSPGDSQSAEWYKRIMLQILEVDNKLDAGLDSTGKRKITNEVVGATEDKWGPVAGRLVEQMQGMDEETLAGVFYGIVRQLTTAFKEPVDKFITQRFEEQPKSTEDQVSEDEKKQLSELRSTLVKQVKQIKDMAALFGEFTEDNPWPEPRRRGAVGKRALTLYTWSIDGVEVDEENDSVKGVSELLGFDSYGKFTQALRDAEIDTTKPPAEFSVTINDKEVSARRVTEEEDEVDEVDAAGDPASNDEDVE